MKKVPVTMNLYADVIFINNFAMDFLLLTILRKIMRLERRRAGILSASILGAGYALAVTVFPLGITFLQGVTTYVIVSAVMVFTAFRVRDMRELLKTVTGLYFTAVLMAGLFGLLRVGGNISFFAYILAAGGCFFLACFLWETVKTTESDNGHLYLVAVFYQGRSKSMTAFMDTGNRLVEPYTHKPVSVISAESCTELFQTVASVFYIPYRCIGNAEGLLPVVKADRMEIEKEGRKVIVEEPFIAISKEPLSRGGVYEMLLNEKIWL